MPIARAVVPLLLVCALASCVTLTEQPRGVSLSGDGSLQAIAVVCPQGGPPASSPGAPGLDPTSLRVLTWNLHKQEDPGWDRDLARMLGGADLALLQEAVMRPDLRAILAARGLDSTMASAFIYRDLDHGVVTSATVPPVATCAMRAVEPLLGIPKTGLIAWYPLAGRADLLAVVNVHAVNFSLALAPYEAQFAALTAALAHHDGPILFAGDLNTWTDGRLAVVRAAAKTLGLREITFEPDLRARFFGQQLDHVLVRGLDLVRAEVTEVKSSDHNPVAVTLRAAAPH